MYVQFILNQLPAVVGGDGVVESVSMEKCMYNPWVTVYNFKTCVQFKLQLSQYLIKLNDHLFLCVCIYALVWT